MSGDVPVVEGLPAFPGDHGARSLLGPRLTVTPVWDDAQEGRIPRGNVSNL
jgi:hypothetical protein